VAPMSALGQKRTWLDQIAMSALPPKAAAAVPDRRVRQLGAVPHARRALGFQFTKNLPRFLNGHLSLLNSCSTSGRLRHRATAHRVAANSAPGVRSTAAAAAAAVMLFASAVMPVPVQRAAAFPAANK
jgi:hypothetical protein